MKIDIGNIVLYKGKEYVVNGFDNYWLSYEGTTCINEDYLNEDNIGNNNLPQ